MISDEELVESINKGWKYWNKLGVRGCPVDTKDRERVAKLWGIPAYKKWEESDAYYFCIVTDKDYMENPAKDSELWFCWE